MQSQKKTKNILLGVFILRQIKSKDSIIKAGLHKWNYEILFGPSPLSVKVSKGFTSAVAAASGVTLV